MAILGISPQIFFILTSVTSDTSWGQSMSLSDLNEVSNFSWGCQLSYETLSVRSVSKLELPETTISHRVILDPPRLLNWPKSPHRLGLKECSLIFSWAKKNPKLEFLYFVFSVRNKKLVNKEVRKISILASKYTFLDFSVKERVALWCLRSSRHQASQANRHKDPRHYRWKIVSLIF